MTQNYIIVMIIIMHNSPHHPDLNSWQSMRALRGQRQRHGGLDSSPTNDLTHQLHSGWHRQRTCYSPSLETAALTRCRSLPVCVYQREREGGSEKGREKVRVCVHGGGGTERERELILSSCTLLQTMTDCVAGYLGEVLLIWCAN